MNTEHTPGPWSTSSSFGVISNDEVICRVRRIRKGQGDANARLIAAAPDLLEALKDILSGWRYIRQDPAHLSIYGVGWDRAQKAAEAAIAKAEGGAE